MTQNGKTIPEAELEMLFVWGGGSVTRTLERFHIARDGRLLPARVVAFTAGVTWLPLLVLALFEGVALGSRVTAPFLKDFLPYGQFFVAVPVLLLGDVLVGRRLGRAMAQLGRAMAQLRRSDVLAPEDTPTLEALATRAVAHWRGPWVNRMILIATIVTTALSFWGIDEWLTGGWQFVNGRLTMAGGYYLLISASVLRFLSLRWVWRLVLWAWVLWRTAKLELQPRATHPDCAGGLAFLGATQASFGVLVFALGIQLSCLIGDAVSYEGVDLMAYRGHVAAFVVIVLTVLIVPLLRFGPKLMRARGDSLVFLSGCAYTGAARLERRLSDDDEQFPADDISGLADFGALYENARGMKPVPLDLRHVVVMVLAAILPFSPLIFLVMPAQEVFQALASLLL